MIHSFAALDAMMCSAWRSRASQLESKKACQRLAVTRTTLTLLVTPFGGFQKSGVPI